MQEGIPAYHYDDIAPDERQTLENHLTSCDACQAFLDEVRETAAALDRMPLALPSDGQWREMDLGLKARLAPLRRERGEAGAAVRTPRQRAARTAGWRGWLPRAVAATLVVGLSATVGQLMHRVSQQQVQISGLLGDVGELSLEVGDVHRAERAFSTLMLTAPRSARVERQLEAIARLRSNDEPVRLYQRAVRAGDDDVRGQLQELVWRFPEHPLAAEAFNKLIERGVPRPRPLVLATLKPIGNVGRPLPGADEAGHYRAEMARLERLAEGAPPKVRAFALLRAARVAEEQLADAGTARTAYERVLAEVESGPVHDAARARLTALAQ
jgi:hypothetical protein